MNGSFASEKLHLDTIRAMYLQQRAYSMPEEVSLDAVSLSSRRKMMKFFFDLGHRIESSRETVEITMSLLDRFLASETGSVAFENKRFFQLAATSCVYISQKIHENVAITPGLLAQLSNGAFTADDVEKMELTIAKTLQWRLNPPTSASFIRNFLDLIPPKSMTRDLKRAISDLARTQCENAMEDPTLMGQQKSLIAYVALLNGAERLHAEKQFVCLQDTLEQILNINNTSDSFVDMRTTLNGALSKKLGVALPRASHSCGPASIYSSSNVPPAPYNASPRSVSNNNVA